MAGIKAFKGFTKPKQTSKQVVPRMGFGDYMGHCEIIASGPQIQMYTKHCHFALVLIKYFLSQQIPVVELPSCRSSAKLFDVKKGLKRLGTIDLSKTKYGGRSITLNVKAMKRNCIFSKIHYCKADV